MIHYIENFSLADTVLHRWAESDELYVTHIDTCHEMSRDPPSSVHMEN